MLIDDTNPQLGGNLDLNNFNISGTGSIDIIGSGNFATNISANSGNFSNLTVSSTGVSLVGHDHTSSDITDFNSSVTGLISVTGILGSQNINVTSNNKLFTVSATGLIKSDTSNITGASFISNMVVISEANYNTLNPKDPNTIYFVT